jgi:predicted ATP-dependent protease
MVNNKTYNNVVNTLLRIGQYHDQISTTSVGDIYDINLEKMEKFPLMHINPTSVTTGDSQLTYNFQIFVMDMVSEKSDWQTAQQALLTKLVNTKNNEQEVFNQTLEICTDIIGMLRHSSRQSLLGVDDINQPLYFTQDQFTIEPFQERFDNLCCGYVFNLGVLVQNDFQTCDIPVNTRGAGY